MTQDSIKGICNFIASSGELAQNGTFQIPLAELQKHALIFVIVKRYGYASTAVYCTYDILTGATGNGYRIYDPNGTASWVVLGIDTNGLLTIKELSGANVYIRVYGI